MSQRPTYLLSFSVSINVEGTDKWTDVSESAIEILSDVQGRSSDREGRFQDKHTSER